MTDAQLSALLIELLNLPQETEWVEWKHNNCDPEMIAQTLAALANAAALHGRECGYMIFGVEDATKCVLGTTFDPRRSRKGNEELENWLNRSLHPQVNLKIHTWVYEGKSMVLIEVPRASHAPVRFGSEDFIRVGSLTKKLKEYPAKEAELWATFSRKPFETGIAKSDLAADEVLTLLDFDRCFKLLKITLPSDQKGILSKLADEALVVARPGGRFDITNLGAMLFANDLTQFERLGRKALRIIKYKGESRTETEREWRDAPSQSGYAVAFEPAVAYINSQLPQQEPIGQAFSEEVRTYPQRAIRELVANCLIHQDFSVSGAGPMVEIFAGRIEITNPGEPLVDTLRFIDIAPRSRNEVLAALLRRMKICEEAGTGIDKAVEAIEEVHLPALNFTVPPGSTRVIFLGQRKFGDLDSKDRLRAVYQHACICHVNGRRMTNASLRERFGIQDENAAQASRLIKDAVKEGFIKLFDPEARRKNASYLPFWA